MIDTIGENGLVPSRLVFENVPRLPIISAKLPKQKERMEAIAKAQMEMNAIVAEWRVLTALSRNVSQYAGYIFRIGDRALVYSENGNRLIGPFVIAQVDGRMITVRTMDGFNGFLCNSFQ